MLFVAAISFHVVAPSIVEVLGSWPRLSSVAPAWLVVIVACEALSFASAILLQRVALRTDAVFAVATSQLAGNAMTQVVPGGAAAGATLQLRMLAQSGADTATAISGFTAFSLLQTASILFLPVLTLPTILLGAPVNRGLAQTAFLGIAGFVVVAGFGAMLLTTDGLLRGIGRFVEIVRNRILRNRHPLTGLPERLVRERDSIRAVLGNRWRIALTATACRLGFDFLALFAALAAVGSLPRPSLALLAYTAASLLAMIPITPGGLGLVEAGLTGALALAGVKPAQAVLATLLYRLASYWIPIVAGPIAYTLFRRRYRASGS
ncbi:MAG TPA: lysylphosphatidylglycerol synthase transmembrane domain-containing protein [Acidimicrobiia bacterium]|jgi:hypothetical protein|nr:lysylphosphatidylglycerol synthase transmembrane domain-containing protein [Acidimicrobiia bacterium]